MTYGQPMDRLGPWGSTTFGLTLTEFERLYIPGPSNIPSGISSDASMFSKVTRE